MIALGIFAKTFSGNNLNARIRSLKASGFTLAHFNMACVGMEAMPEEIPETVIQEIQQCLKEEGISLCGISATYNMAHPDPLVRAEGLKRLEVIARRARAIGTDFISLCTGTRDPLDKWQHHPDNSSKEAWEDMRASMESALLLAEKYDLRLGIEPEHANVVKDAHAAKRLLSEMQSPHLGIILDPANLFERAEVEEIKVKIDLALDLLGDHLFMAHAKGRDSQGNFVAAGRGIIPFDYFIKQLQFTHFQGPLVAHGLDEKEASLVKQYLRRYSS
ncbi:MAG: sugar phosphate isomerase/epimerase family protein [Bacteroidota bacterium]